MKRMLSMSWIFALATLLDRLSKFWAITWLRAQPGQTFPLLPNVLHCTYAQNTGISFSLLNMNRWGLVGLTFLSLTVATVVIIRCLPDLRLRAASLLLILAGGLGNLVDRIAYGFVVDFLEVKLFRFAIFNVADICVSLGAGLLILLIFCAPSHGASASPKREGDACGAKDL